MYIVQSRLLKLYRRALNVIINTNTNGLNYTNIVENNKKH